jgi:hypothetical protein
LGDDSLPHIVGIAWPAFKPNHTMSTNVDINKTQERVQFLMAELQRRGLSPSLMNVSKLESELRNNMQDTPFADLPRIINTHFDVKK